MDAEEVNEPRLLREARRALSTMTLARKALDNGHPWDERAAWNALNAVIPDLREAIVKEDKK